MKYSPFTRRLGIPLFIGVFFFSACSTMAPMVPGGPGDLKTSSEAGEIVAYLKNQNLHLKTFKGIGRITFLEHEKKDLTTRVAWAGSAPDRLRVVLRSVSGQPVVSVASDGQWIYLVDHTRGKFYKKHAGGSTMKKFFSIPVTSDDIVHLLAGRVSVDNYDSAAIQRNGGSTGPMSGSPSCPTPVSNQKSLCEPEDGYVLVLKKGRGNNTFQKIYLDASRKQVCKVEIFYLTGNLKYRAEFKTMQDIDGYRVPSRLVLTSHDGSGFQLDVDRYWAGVSVSPSLFVLMPPE
jgi:outer membrane lipoprotein-sorting protein